MRFTSTTTPPAAAPPPPLPAGRAAVLRRLAGGVLGVLAAVLLLNLLAGASTANAIPFVGDCKSSPQPEAAGQTGVIGDDPPLTWPKQVDPNNVYASYGFGGTTWKVYDPGCVNAGGLSAASIADDEANTMMWVNKQWLGVLAAINVYMFHPTMLGPLDPMISQVAHKMKYEVFDTWVVVVLALLATWIGWRALQGRVGQIIAAVGFGIVVMILATAVANAPMRLVHGSDHLTAGFVADAAASVNGGWPEDEDPGSVATGALYQTAIYQQWAAGEVGPDKYLIQKYGPRLLADQSISWQEQWEVQHAGPPGSPARDQAAKALVDKKRADFKDVAAQIKAEDGYAYSVLKGDEPYQRFTAAVRSWFVLLFSVPFAVISGVIMLFSYLIVRAAVMFFALFCLFGLMPATRNALIGVVMAVGAAILNTGLFGGLTAVYTSIVGVLLGPDSKVPMMLAFIVLIFFFWAFWYLGKPFRKLHALVPSGGGGVFDRFVDAGPAAVRKPTKMAKKAVKTYWKAEVTARRTASRVVAEQEAARKRDSMVDQTVPPPRVTGRPLEPAAAGPAPAGTDLMVPRFSGGRGGPGRGADSYADGWGLPPGSNVDEGERANYRAGAHRWAPRGPGEEGYEPTTAGRRPDADRSGETQPPVKAARTRRTRDGEVHQIFVPGAGDFAEPRGRGQRVRVGDEEGYARFGERWYEQAATADEGSDEWGAKD